MAASIVDERGVGRAFEPADVESRLQRLGVDGARAKAITYAISEFVLGCSPGKSVSTMDIDDVIIRHLASHAPMRTRLNAIDPIRQATVTDSSTVKNELRAGRRILVSPTIDHFLLHPMLGIGSAYPGTLGLPAHLPPPVLRGVLADFTAVVYTGGALAAEIPAEILWRQFWKLVAEWLAERGITIAGIALADGPLPIGKLIALGLHNLDHL